MPVDGSTARGVAEVGGSAAAWCGLTVDVTVDRREFTVRAAFAVKAGERVAIFGPSGAGKSTVLEAIAGLVPRWRGQVIVNGRELPPELPPWRRGIGLLRQDPGLFPHLSVRDNLLYAPGAREEELPEIAAELGIDTLLAARPAALSGGQAHRVALARMLLAHCDALLFDEPYTGLDAGLATQLTELLRTVAPARSVPSILVAHELAEAQAFADRMLILDSGEILQDGLPDEVVARPASRRVAELVGYRAFLPHNGGIMAVHPDRVVAGAGDGVVVRGSITGCRPSGAGWAVTADVDGVPVSLRLPERPLETTFDFTVIAPPVFGGTP